MAGQIFINEVRCNFNLREPKADKPTNIYLVASISLCKCTANRTRQYKQYYS